MKTIMLTVFAGMVAAVAAYAEPITPSGDSSGAADRATIQAAIDAAATEVPAGVVTLGAGQFEIDAQLMVTGGVSLVGQGWTNTVVRYAGKAGADCRVVQIADASTVSGLALTGGKVNNNYGAGGGIVCTDGTISWCCITNNYAERGYGGGVFVGGTGVAKIDHTIIAGNLSGTAFMNGGGGGIGIRADNKKTIELEIDTCLIYGNVAGSDRRTSHGGAVYIDQRGTVATVIRNSTIVDNATHGAESLCGGLYIAQKTGATTLVNCIFADNTTEAGIDGNVGFADEQIASSVALLASNCLSSNDTAAFGESAATGDPLFKDVAARDYRLTARSPAVNRGMRTDEEMVDLRGNKRVGKPDIGCFELPPQRMVIRFR